MSAERLDRCPTCRSQDVDQPHADRCKLRDETSSTAVKHGRDLDSPIHGQKTGDLWAHIHTRTGDPEAARDVVRQVIDLGWRPVVGKYDLWAPQAAVEAPLATSGLPDDQRRHPQGQQDASEENR